MKRWNLIAPLFFLCSVTLYPPEEEAELLTLLEKAQEAEKKFWESGDDIVEAQGGLREALNLYSYVYTFEGSWDALQGLIRLYRAIKGKTDFPSPRFGYSRKRNVEVNMEHLSQVKQPVLIHTYHLWLAEVVNRTTHRIAVSKNSLTAYDIQGKSYQNIPFPFKIPEIKAIFSKNPEYFKTLEVRPGPRVAASIKLLFPAISTPLTRIIWDLEEEGSVEIYFYENLFP